MHVQIKHSLAHLQDLIPTLAGFMQLNLVDVLENALFVHAFGYMVELTVTGWCIIAIHGYF